MCHGKSPNELSIELLGRLDEGKVILPQLPRFSEIASVLILGLIIHNQLIGLRRSDGTLITFSKTDRKRLLTSTCPCHKATSTRMVKAVSESSSMAFWKDERNLPCINIISCRSWIVIHTARVSPRFQRREWCGEPADS